MSINSRLRALRGIDQTGGHLPAPQRQRWNPQEREEERRERVQKLLQERAERHRRVVEAVGTARCRRD